MRLADETGFRCVVFHRIDHKNPDRSGRAGKNFVKVLCTCDNDQALKGCSIGLNLPPKARSFVAIRLDFEAEKASVCHDKVSPPWECSDRHLAYDNGVIVNPAACEKLIDHRGLDLGLTEFGGSQRCNGTCFHGAI